MVETTEREISYNTGRPYEKYRSRSCSSSDSGFDIMLDSEADVTSNGSVYDGDSSGHFDDVVEDSKSEDFKQEGNENKGKGNKKQEKKRGTKTKRNYRSRSPTQVRYILCVIFT